MTNSIDLTYQARVFHCRTCGAILGYVLRNVQRVRGLYVLTSQLRSDEAVPETPVIVSAATDPQRHWFRVLAMDSGCVACDFCGARNEWYATEEAMREILLRARGQWGVREFNKLMAEVQNG